VLAGVLPGEPAIVAKRELSGQLVAGPLLRRLGIPFVERYDVSGSLADAQALIDLAREGRTLVFFPEGTFTRRAGLSAFYLGAFCGGCGGQFAGLSRRHPGNTDNAARQPMVSAASRRQRRDRRTGDTLRCGFPIGAATPRQCSRHYPRPLRRARSHRTGQADRTLLAVRWSARRGP
jgi:hypothetical protein